MYEYIDQFSLSLLCLWDGKSPVTSEFPSQNPAMWSFDVSFVVVLYMYETHYIDVIMTTMASQITSLTVVYSTVYSDADQRKHQTGTGEFPAQRASYAENVSIWWRHHDQSCCRWVEALWASCDITVINMIITCNARQFIAVEVWKRSEHK